jgi:hypothetical protein
MAELLAAIYARMDGPPLGTGAGGAGAARREGKPVGRQPGATDKRPRKRSGYVARWRRERDTVPAVVNKP